MDIKLKSIKVSVKLPYIGGIEGNWEPNEKEKNAAWEIYVELITRVTIIPLGPGEGILREALSSMYDIFKITREVLKKYGPDIAKPKDDGELSLAYIAISVLNYGIRPFLSKWHPLLLDYEIKKSPDISQFEHESCWDLSKQLRDEIEETRKSIMSYANLLALAAGVPPII